MNTKEKWKEIDGKAIDGYQATATIDINNNVCIVIPIDSKRIAKEILEGMWK